MLTVPNPERLKAAADFDPTYSPWRPALRVTLTVAPTYPLWNDAPSGNHPRWSSFARYRSQPAPMIRTVCWWFGTVS